MPTLNEESKRLIQDACRRLTGVKRRAYQAEITQQYVHGSARKAERELGWGRDSVAKGRKEASSGIRCCDAYQQRGRQRTEDRSSGLKDALHALAEPQKQADPAMKSSLTYTRLTGKATRAALMADYGFRDDNLPTANTIGTILNRLGYNLKRVLKTKPVKKFRRSMTFLRTCGRSTVNPMPIRPPCGFQSMRKSLSGTSPGRARPARERRKKRRITT